MTDSQAITSHQHCSNQVGESVKDGGGGIFTISLTKQNIPTLPDSFYELLYELLHSHQNFLWNVLNDKAVEFFTDVFRERI